eukprot:5895922-Amphidinium_carterae.1
MGGSKTIEGLSILNILCMRRGSSKRVGSKTTEGVNILSPLPFAIFCPRGDEHIEHEAWGWEAGGIKKSSPAWSDNLGWVASDFTNA